MPQAEDDSGPAILPQDHVQPYQVFLEMQGVEMLEGDVWGHRKDLDEYFTVENSTLEEIRALAASGASATMWPIRYRRRLGSAQS